MAEEVAANVSLSTTSGKFEDSFWGKDNGGYSVLHNNLKGSVVVGNTLADYIKELMAVEKSYIKGLQKLSKYLQQIPDVQLGSYYPVWLVLMKMVDGIGVGHEQHVASLGELMSQVTQYSSKQDDKMKGNMKGDIAGAHKSLSAYTKSRSTVGKSRKSYRHSCSDLIEARCELERAKQEGVGKGKEMDKLEVKVKKATGHMESALKDHRSAVQHQADQLSDFKDKMTTACQRFESLENEHIDQMLIFTSKLLVACDTCASKQSTEYSKAKEKFEQLPSSKLLQMFAQIRGTGRRKPEPYSVTVINIEEEVKKNIHSRPESPAANKTKSGLFKSKKKKSASPAAPSQSTAAPSAGAASGDTSGTTGDESKPAVDQEGYSIRPQDADKITWSDEEKEDSDSDSDWEDETEKKLKGLHIKEKPIVTVGGPSLDDLNKAVGSIILGGGSIRSATSSSSLHSLGSSTTPTLQRSNQSSSSIDPQASLMDLVLQPTPLLPAPSSDQSLSLSPLPPPLLPFIDVSASLPDTPPSFHRPLEAQETPPLQRPLVPQETPPLQRPLVPQETPPLQRPMVPQETPPLQRPLVPKETPPLQRPLVAQETPPLQRPQETAPLQRPLDSLLPPPPVAASRRRGPSESPPPPTSHVGSSSAVSPISPLALSQHTATNDIPIAVAFQETCNAIFKGSDPTRAIVKVTGEVIFSFSAMYLSELSPHKTPLQFSLSNHDKLSRVLHNQHLMERKNDNLYVFMMDKLCLQLQQMRAKHSLSFYNIQVLKYEVVLTGASDLPLQLSCMWKCAPLSTTYTLHYSHTAPPTVLAPAPPPLKNVCVVVPFGVGTVTSVVSQPEGVWSQEQGKLSWTIGDVSSDQAESKSLTAALKLSSGPSSPSPTIVQFMCDGCTLSGSSLQLIGQGYKISLHKNKLISGRYMAEPAQHLNQ